MFINLDGMVLIKIFIIFQLFKNSGQLCSTEVCFTWKVKPNELVLTCRVSPLKFRIKIVDPFNNIQADCTTPIPVETCEAHYKNVTITQDAKTQKTIFEVHGKIDNRVNGIWTCLHGTGRGNASVEVTVLTIPNNNVIRVNKTKHTDEDDNKCLRDAFLLGVSSFMFAAICTYSLRTLKNLPAEVEWEDCKNWKYVLIFICGLAILALLLYSCTTSSLDCRLYNWVVGSVSFAVGIFLAIIVTRKLPPEMNENGTLWAITT